MKISIFAYSRQGCFVAKKILAVLPDEECRAFTIGRFAPEADFGEIPKPSGDFYGEQFEWADAMIFVGACGIAVRSIAPHLKSKATDPAVLCADELGDHVISLLSGHIGGANELARRVAGRIGALPVITTATDINDRFSVDAWASRQGFLIGSMYAAKAVSAQILERDVPLISDFPVRGKLPGGIVPGKAGKRAKREPVGILISVQKREPFEETLTLIPRVLHLGIGCRRGTAAEAIQEAVELALDSLRLDMRAVKCAASIDLKAEEAGLLEFCRKNSLPVSFYTAEELQAVEGNFTASEFVQQVTGVDNVCERAALLGAKELLIRKTAKNGVTVAVAAEELEVCFE